MAVIDTRDRGVALHPLHAVLLASTLPLFLGAVLSDWAYASTYEIQWTNFASWLIAGGLLFGVIVLAWALVAWFVDAGRPRGRATLYLVAVLAMWVTGFINALVHGKDAWAGMPEGLVLSVVVALLAIVATWIGFSTPRAGGVR